MLACSKYGRATFDVRSRTHVPVFASLLEYVEDLEGIVCAKTFKTHTLRFGENAIDLSRPPLCVPFGFSSSSTSAGGSVIVLPLYIIQPHTIHDVEQRG